MIKLPPLKDINFKNEVIGGITTFLTMSYIIIVNPSILSTDGTGMSFAGVLAATVILSASMTFLMGVFAGLPYAIAPGMGINAFFTFTVILGKQVPWQTALGMVFWSGVLFLIISLTSWREKIVRAIPKNLQVAASIGIGLFLTFIGLKNCGLIISDPVTLVKFGSLHVHSLLSIMGLFIIAYLMRKKSSIAFLTGILTITLVALLTGQVQLPEQYLSTPDFSSTFFKLNFLDALELSFLPVILSLLLTDLFDSMATFVGVSQASGLVEKDGHPKNLKQGLIVDAVATFFSGILGTSSGTTFIESASGIEAGAKAGWASVVTAFCFLPFLFIAPLIAIIPSYATGPVLIYVGFLMFGSVKKLEFDKTEELIPAFLTIILIPLSFSITKGILAGFISYVVLGLTAKKKVHPIMIFLGVISLILFYLEN